MAEGVGGGVGTVTRADLAVEVGDVAPDRRLADHERISDFAGTDGYLESGSVVAGTPKVYAALSKLLAPYTRGVVF